MLAKILTGTTVGLEGILIEVEVDVAEKGFPTLQLVGLPNKAVEEAKDRVRTAINNTSFEMPDSRITINLAPADIPKTGSGFDLPIAVGILMASGVLKHDAIRNSLFIGELSLEGKIRSVPGIISICLMAAKRKIHTIFVPIDNAQEAAMIEGLTVIPVPSLADLVFHINGITCLQPHPLVNIDQVSQVATHEFDFYEIKGQSQAKRALEIAAAGFHNIHLKGVPGAGKTMLSKAFTSILPPMDKDEIIDVSQIYSAVGLLNNHGFITRRPFRSPHHTTSRIGLIGGGTNPTPGEVSLAHRGVLFLDEFPEFPRSVLEALRQPLEDGIVSISRASGSVTFPCRFLLLAASNPCQCGYLGHPTKKCQCMPGAILNYRKKLSGPLLDRIDLHIDVPPVTHDLLINNTFPETSASICARVLLARNQQQKRFNNTQIKMNGEMSPREIKKYCHIQEKASELLKSAISRFGLSARSFFKIIKVSQTIADLEQNTQITSAHIAEALQYRIKEEL